MEVIRTRAPRGATAAKRSAALAQLVLAAVRDGAAGLQLSKYC
jgi:hypothetical protein